MCVHVQEKHDIKRPDLIEFQLLLMKLVWESRYFLRNSAQNKGLRVYAQNCILNSND